MEQFSEQDQQQLEEGAVSREELYLKYCKTLKECLSYMPERPKATVSDYLGLSIEMANYVIYNPEEAAFETLKDLAKLLRVSPKFLLCYYGVAQRKLTYLDAVQIGAALTADGLQAA